jgi:DNA-binding IclR family transcriptional regulator
MKQRQEKVAGAVAKKASPKDIHDSSSAGTVARVVKLLTCVAEADGEVSIKYLCQSLNLPASTIHRLLSLLIQEGVIERAAAQALYAPGMEFIRIASLVTAKIHIVDIARPIMRALVDECDETCVLLRYVPSSRKVMAVHAEYSSHPLRYQIDLFQPRSLLWGATGRSVLAYLPEEQIDTVLKDDDRSPGSGQPLPPRNTMLKELRDIRERGYAATQGQTIAGAVGLGAPLFSSERQVIGCLSITIPKARFNQKAAAKLSSALLARASQLNRNLGFQS